VHDEKPRMQWRLTIVEELIKGRDNLIHAAHVRMNNYRTTHPIVKLYPLEVSHPTSEESSDDSNGPQDLQDSRETVREVVNSNTTSSSDCHGHRKAASKVLERISNWTSIRPAPRGCRK